MKKDIYIIRNKINDKVYIGQAANVQDRWAKHLYDSTRNNKNKTLIAKAIAKHGKENFYIEILEEQVENFDEREQFWIKEYDSQQPNGYNVAPGGKSIGTGVNAINAKLDEKSLKELIDDIKNTTISFNELTKKYNCGRSVISRVNLGQRYHQDDLQYPLRPKPIIDENLVNQINNALLFELNKTMTEIAQEYGVKYSFVTELNNGRSSYRKADKTYPLRVADKQLMSAWCKEKIENRISYIKDLLINDTALDLIGISQKVGVSVSLVSDINNGVAHYDPNLDYPLNKNKKLINRNTLYRRLDKHKVELIEKLLVENEKSIHEIADFVNVSTISVYNLNNGCIKKYHDENKTYPLRPKKSLSPKK